MGSRLTPLLLAGCAAAAIGCGATGASGPRADAGNATGARGSRAGQATGTAGSHTHASGASAASGSRTDVRSAGSRAAAGRAHLWAVGDSAGGAHAAAVATLIRRHRPDRVLYLGDIYNGASGFRAFKRLYGHMPVARTPGNHDWPHYWSGSEWYTFTAGGWRIIELNSETSHGGEQLAWLRQQLRARGNCRLAFWHRPRYSAGLHGDNPDMDPYWRALEGHARLVLSGHDHDMQRFASRGTLTQLVAGAGGQSHYRIDRQRSGLAFADDRDWGALRLDLSRGRAEIRFVTTSDRTVDTHRVTCQP
jgi:calcineurin-like phosphoesterase family protein